MGTIVALRVESVECKEPGCHSPAAHVMGELLMIESRHHGERHTTLIPVRELLALLDKQKETVIR